MKNHHLIFCKNLYKRLFAILLIAISVSLVAGCYEGIVPPPGGGGGGVVGGQLAQGSYEMSWNQVTDINVTGYKVFFSVTPFGVGTTVASFVISDLNVTAVDFVPSEYDLRAGQTLYAAVVSTGPNNTSSPLSEVQSILLD